MRYVNPNHPAGALFPQSSGFGLGRRSKAFVGLTPELADPLGVGRETQAREEARRVIAEEFVDGLAVAVFGTPILRYQQRVLTAQDILEIKTLVSDGMKQAEIAERFGVNRTTIWRVNTGHIWAAA